MSDLFLQVSAGGIFAVLVIRMVFDFVGKRNGGSNLAGKINCPISDPQQAAEVREQMGRNHTVQHRMATQVNELHAWHSSDQGKAEEMYRWHEPDATGEQPWRGRGLTKILESMDAGLQENTTVLRELRDEIKNMNGSVARTRKSG